MNKRLLLFSILFCFMQESLAQKFISSSTEGVTIQLEHAPVKGGVEGTFQFIVKSIEHKVLRNEDFEFMIESNRKETEDVFMKLDDEVVLFIPSRLNINQPGYQKLAEYKIQD